MSEQWGKRIRAGGALFALVLAMLAVSPASRASTLPGGQGVLGSLTITDSLQISGPGFLSVKVTDLGVPLTIGDRLSSLSFSIDNGKSPLALHENSGEVVLGINAAGLYTVCINAVAGGRFNIGVLSWQVVFTPSATPVPLPAGVWLLLAGVGAAIGLQRRRGMLRSRGDESFTGPGLVSC